MIKSILLNIQIGILCRQWKIRKSGISAQYFRNNKVNKSYMGNNGMPIVENIFCQRFLIYKEG